MDSAHFTAQLAVKALDEGDLDGFNDHLFDLERTLGSCREVRRYLTLAGAPLAFLREASRAAAEGDEGRMNRFKQKAIRYVGEEEVDALVEENRFSFCVRQSDEQETRRLVRFGGFNRY